MSLKHDSVSHPITVEIERPNDPFALSELIRNNAIDPENPSDLVILARTNLSVLKL